MHLALQALVLGTLDEVGTDCDNTRVRRSQAMKQVAITLLECLDVAGGEGDTDLVDGILHSGELRLC